MSPREKPPSGILNPTPWDSNEAISWRMVATSASGSRFWLMMVTSPAMAESWMLIEGEDPSMTSTWTSPATTPSLTRTASPVTGRTDHEGSSIHSRQASLDPSTMTDVPPMMRTLEMHISEASIRLRRCLIETVRLTYSYRGATSGLLINEASCSDVPAWMTHAARSSSPVSVIGRPVRTDPGYPSLASTTARTLEASSISMR